MKGFLPLLAAALMGGGISAGLLLGTGATTQRPSRTIVQAPSLAAITGGSALAGGGDGGMTVSEIYRRDAPGVVFVRARSVQASRSPFDLGQRTEDVATGAGFVIDGTGRLLTNAHVVSGATDVRVTFSGTRTVPARVVGKDDDSDLAVLQVDPSGLDLHPLALGDSSSVRVGDPTVAIGNPFGLDRTLTTGVISAKQRRITAPSGFSIDNVLQTDAAINPGNSGGPLIDATGRVIGVNSQIVTAGSQGSVGIGFAVPIDTARAIIPALEAHRMVSRAYLGVRGEDATAPLVALSDQGGQGVVVQSVDPGGPAQRAGIVGADAVSSGAGDTITSVDGKPVHSMADVDEILDRHRPGDGLAVGLLRGGHKLTVQVQLSERPASVPIG